MLVYQPAFDIYHTIFRSLKILLYGKKEYELLRLRIYDFYYLFPAEFEGMTFPNELRLFKKYYKNFANPYNQILDKKRIFERLEPIQNVAYNCLLAYNFIDKKSYEMNLLKLIKNNIPPQLFESVTESNALDSEILSLLCNFDYLPLFGHRGLKERTNLMETKYDTN